MISESSNVALALAEMVASGRITTDSWYTAMRREILDNYTTQYLVGIGGRGQMTKADWGSVGGMVADQYRYLVKFLAEIQSGSVSMRQIAFRSGMYINSSREGYERARKKTSGYRGYTEHKWLRKPGSDSCTDCLALDDLGWLPIDEEFVSPSTGNETLPCMGDTICLTKCNCEILYK